MKVSSILNFLNELPKRYSFSLLACSGFLFAIEVLFYPIIFLIVASFYYKKIIIEVPGVAILIFVILIPTLFLSLLFLKICFIIKWFIKEQRNSNVRIKLKFVNTKLYKICYFLSLLCSLIICYYCVYSSFETPYNEILLHITKIYYTCFSLIILTYFFLIKSKKSIKTDIIFYIFFYLFALSCIIYFFMPY